MAHKTRAEQFNVKARKDPRKLAKRTRQHTPKNTYKRVRLTKENYHDETLL